VAGNAAPEQLGVDTMRAVAFGVRGSNPARQHSFIVTEELAPTLSLEDYCCRLGDAAARAAPETGVDPAVSPNMAGKMHGPVSTIAISIICHFLLHLEPQPTADRFRLSLIDLHRAQVRAVTPRRWRDKDLAALYFSALDIGLTQA
jgi:heptose I phosphotransferase